MEATEDKSLGPAASRNLSAQDHLALVIENKKVYEGNRANLPFEDKLKILAKLQEKAYFFGKTKVKPWPV